jgi:hypothetical protein
MKAALVFRRCGAQPTLELGLSWDKAHMTFRSSDDPESGVGKQENGAPEEIRTPNLLIRSQKDDFNFWRFSEGFRALVSTFGSKTDQGFPRVSRVRLKPFSACFGYLIPNIGGPSSRPRNR